VADRRLQMYLVLLAPALVRIDGATEDPEDVAVAEAILVAAESADGVGLARSEIAVRAGLDVSDARFVGRFNLLVRAGALRRLRGNKKHQTRYSPDPVALLAAEILARLAENHGAEELHSLLVAAADRLEAAFSADQGRRAPTTDEVAAFIGKLAALLHAYAQRMEDAILAGTYEELIQARTGSSTGRQMIQIERVCRLINRGDSPYRALFHNANQLLAAGQRFVAAAERLTDRLVEAASSGDGVLSLADYDDYRNAAIHGTPERLSAVAASVPLDATPPLVHLADLAAAAALLDIAPRTRTIPEPPAPDGGLDPRAAFAERQRRAEQRSAARRGWAERLLADRPETDLADHATRWPHAARLLADVMALSRDPTVPLAADIGDPPLIEPGAEVAVRHPLRLRRIPTAPPPAAVDAQAEGGEDGNTAREVDS
jgi:hypothetical protein